MMLSSYPLKVISGSRRTRFRIKSTISLFIARDFSTSIMLKTYQQMFSSTRGLVKVLLSAQCVRLIRILRVRSLIESLGYSRPLFQRISNILPMQIGSLQNRNLISLSFLCFRSTVSSLTQISNLSSREIIKQMRSSPDSIMNGDCHSSSKFTNSLRMISSTMLTALSLIDPRNISIPSQMKERMTFIYSPQHSLLRLKYSIPFRSPISKHSTNSCLLQWWWVNSTQNMNVNYLQFLSVEIEQSYRSYQRLFRRQVIRVSLWGFWQSSETQFIYESFTFVLANSRRNLILCCLRISTSAFLASLLILV